jgi:hypothetical protein
MLELCIGEVLVGFDIFSFYLGSSLGAGQWRFLKGFTGFSTGRAARGRPNPISLFIFHQGVLTEEMGREDLTD